MTKLYQATILLLIVVVLCLLTCNACKQKVKGDTVTLTETEVVTDVVILPYTDTFIKEVPKPYAYIPNHYVDARDITPEIIAGDTVWAATDTAGIIADYIAARVYSRKYESEYGNVVIEDTVSGNRLGKSQAKWSLNIPNTTTTITNTAQAKQRNKVLLGFNTLYTTADSVMYGGASLTFLNKKGVAIEGGAAIGTNQKFAYYAGMKFTLSLRKSK